MSQKFYLTTTLPYVNADPHIGFALEIVQADVIARHRRLLGDEVAFNTGTDEHGLKIYQKALEAGKDPQAYVDEYAAKFGRLKEALNISYTHFVRTTDPHHISAAQEFWRRCAAKGDIEKKLYASKYCVGCELEKTDSELEGGRCPIHPNLEIQITEEENYFFKFSRYQKPLLELYRQAPNFVVPDFRLNEIKAFVSRGLQDFSISRLRSKMPWGVPVPGDDGHVMYVWFDALVNYISTLGWPEREDGDGFWPGIQFAGKDNLRQQAAMWQAMLMSAGAPSSKQIMIHGFITSNGQKMSKSLGNVVDPFELVEEYGADAIRYYLLGALPSFEDGDFTREQFKEIYNAYLANGIGNLTARILKLAVTYDAWPQDEELQDPADMWRKKQHLGVASAAKHLDDFVFSEAIDKVWILIRSVDSFIQEKQPFKLVKADPAAAKELIAGNVVSLWTVAAMLVPFLPDAAQKIMAAIQKREVPPILFPRK